MAAGQGVIYVLQVVVIVILANLLTPEQYGLATVAFVVVSLGFVFTELGLTAAIVQKQDLTESDLEAAFLVNAASGLAITVCVAALAPLVAAIYGRPVLTGLLLVASLSFTVSLGIVHTALLERAGRFKALTAIDLSSTVFGWAVTVTAAVLGAGAMSLMIGPLLQIVLKTALVWRCARWTPHGWGSRDAYAHAWRFGRGVTGFNLVYFVSYQIDTVVVSRVAGTAVLGLYNRAYNLTRGPVEQAYWVFDRLLLPTFSRLQDDPVRLRAAVLRAVRFSALLTFPALLGLAVVAEPLVQSLLGDSWLDMVPLLQILAVASAPQAAVSILRTVFTAAGETRLLFRYGLVQNSLTIVAVLIGSSWGATGVATALLLRAWLGLPWQARAPLALLELPWTAVLRPILPVMGCAFVMSVCVMASLRSSAGLPALVQLLIGVTVGALVYLGSALIFARSALDDLRALLPIRRQSAQAS